MFVQYLPWLRKSIVATGLNFKIYSMGLGMPPGPMVKQILASGSDPLVHVLSDRVRTHYTRVIISSVYSRFRSDFKNYFTRFGPTRTGPI